MEVSRDLARGGKRVAGQARPGGGDSVGVVGRQEAVVAVHGGAPVRVVQVVAHTLYTGELGNRQIRVNGDF